MEKIMGGEDDNSRITSHQWRVPYTNNNYSCDECWIRSDYFQESSGDKLKFRMYAQKYNNNFSIRIKIHKKGSSNYKKIIVDLKINENHFKRTEIIGSNKFSDILSFENMFYEGSIITCRIRIPDDNLKKTHEEEIMLKDSMRADHMTNYLFSSELSDVTIKVKDEEIAAHKIILASSSPVFKEMFNTEMKEAKENLVRLDDFDINLVKEFLKFLYTGKTEEESNVDLLIQLLAFADMYQLYKLKIYCQCKLIENLNADNVIEVAVQVDKYDLPRIKDRILDFMVSNKAKISFSDALFQAPYSQVLRDFFFKEANMSKL